MAVNNIIKTSVYAVLILMACLFFHGFYKNYNRLMETTVDDEATLNKDKVVAHQMTSSVKFSNVILYGGAFFASVLVLSLLAGHDVSNYIGHRFGKYLFNNENEAFKDSDYEIAEQKWADGSYLDAIQLMRDYLQKNPQQQHVAIRIAEIYEKDLHNPLAAALEYEEVLKEKLPEEQWGWTAIHLCNLYNSKLDKHKMATELLMRIVKEHPNVAAAEKARKRLEADGEDSGLVQEEQPDSQEPAPAPAPQVAEAPAPTPQKTAKAPDNTQLQNIFNKLHQPKTRSSQDKETS